MSAQSPFASSLLCDVTDTDEQDADESVRWSGGAERRLAREVLRSTQSEQHGSTSSRTFGCLCDAEMGGILFTETSHVTVNTPVETNQYLLCQSYRAADSRT